MFKPDEYKLFHAGIQTLGADLINTPAEYDRLHLFPHVYPFIKDDTPQSISFSDPSDISAEVVNKTFEKFIIKDYVKSVKGHDFPASFTTPLTQKELDDFISRFIELRQPLFTGGIVLKDFIELKRYGEKATNEYRAFYLNNHVLTVSRNSNQPEDSPVVPRDLVERCAHLPSRYYTVDFGEMEDGSFIILETGDGQVSGLSPHQNVSKYYNEMIGILRGFNT
ncbi:MAG: ATP-grasp domain-containing protein [Peptococcaceae bacterium]|nr:ATP-grasp domain-containing protein [Peptococcaceae bacterium]